MGNPREQKPLLSIREADEQDRGVVYSRLSSIFMITAWSALTIALFGWGKIISNYILVDDNISTLIVSQFISTTLAFITGWTMALISIRRLNNRVLPLLARLYSGLVTVGMMAVYSRIIYLIYFELDFENSKFSPLLIAASLVVVMIFLLTDDTNMTYLVLPLALGVFFHVILTIFKFAFFIPVNSSFLTIPSPK
jgi:hypothetical protein